SPHPAHRHPPSFPTRRSSDLLEAAGSYRAEHPLESEPSPFVGAARCAACHRDTVSALQASRHASTLVRGKPLTKLPYPDRPLPRSEEHTSELQSRENLVCRLL